MTKGTGPGVLIIIGIMLILVGIMWDGSIGMSYQDLNNSTTANTTAHAETSAGQLFSSGFGMLLVAFGVLSMIGAILMVVFNNTKIGGR